MWSDAEVRTMIYVAQERGMANRLLHWTVWSPIIYFSGLEWWIQEYVVRRAILPQKLLLAFGLIFVSIFARSLTKELAHYVHLLNMYRATKCLNQTTKSVSKYWRWHSCACKLYTRRPGLCTEVNSIRRRERLTRYNTIKDVANLLKKSKRIMVLSGAGICTSMTSSYLKSNSVLRRNQPSLRGSLTSGQRTDCIKWLIPYMDWSWMILSKYLTSSTSKKTHRFFSEWSTTLLDVSIQFASARQFLCKVRLHKVILTRILGLKIYAIREIYPSTHEPSLSHYFIKRLEEKKKVIGMIYYDPFANAHAKLLRNYTQNIDGLENSAGIKNVLQCHGSFSEACHFCRRWKLAT